MDSEHLFAYIRDMMNDLIDLNEESQKIDDYDEYLYEVNVKDEDYDE